jgi:hypothetical protein
MRKQMAEDATPPAVSGTLPTLQPPAAFAPAEHAQRWYLPTWWDRLVLMKWRVIYFVPALLIVPLLVLAPFSILLWWKLLVPAVGLPLAAAVNAAKQAVRLRKEPFCVHCGYDLTSLPDGHRCPECGVPFHLVEIDDYRRDPHWFIERRRRGTPLPPSGAAIDAGPKRSRKSRDGT